jgi:hypothetical protein
MNYVQLLANQLRSLLRGNLRKIDFLTLWPRLEDEVRNVILGMREGDEDRPGRTFDIDNGMHVLAVDVIDSKIIDPNIADRMQRVQQTSVTLRIGDREAEDKLKSDELRADICDKTREIQAAQFRKNKEDESMRSQVQHALEMEDISRRWAEHNDESKRRAEEEQAVFESELQMKSAQTDASNECVVSIAQSKAEAAAKMNEEEHSHALAMAGVQMKLTEANSSAIVAERQAVQPGLIEALNGFGQAQLAGKAAENMGLVSLFKGDDAMSILQKFCGDSRVGRVIQDMRDRYTGVVEQDDKGTQRLPKSSPFGGDPQGGSRI